MGIPGTALINGQWAFVDSDDPGTALGYLSAAGQGGGVLFHVSEFLVLNGTLLSTITDAGSGVIISTAERAGLHGHTNTTTLDQLLPPTAGQTGYVRTATAAGVETWMAAPVTSVNDRGWWANLAALKAGVPTGQAGWYATLINSGAPATVAVWDADAGPADWVEIGVASVTSVDPSGNGSGIQSGAVVFDADDITEGASNLWLSVAERASVATIAGLATTVGTNTTLATHGNIDALNGVSDSGSGVIISVAERATVDDLANPATPADDDKVWTATAGVGGWTTFVPGGAGTVTSVNGVSPVSGDVTLTMDDMTEGTSKILTQSERTSIVNSAAVAAANATLIARYSTQQSLSVVALSIDFDIGGGLQGVVTLTGGTAVTLPLLTSSLGGGIAASVGETALLIVNQDGTGGATLDTSAFQQPGGVEAVLSTAPNAKDMISIYIESAAVMNLTVLKNVKSV